MQNEPERSGFRRGRQQRRQVRPSTHRSSAATPTNGFRAVRRRELVIFFVLSYLIAWSTLPFGSFLPSRPSCRQSLSSRSPRACQAWLDSVGASFAGE